MNVLSLFDGMSCGQIALRELGVKVEKYYASDIDKYAIQQTQHNFPNTIQLGDVTQVKAKDLDKIDIVIGGSPCQGFSFAGKQLNFDDPRSALFFEFVRILNECREINPDVLFLLENVNMKRRHMGVISKYLGVFPVNINSNLVSAQNRNRWFWSNIKTKKEGFFDEVWTDFPQPEDKGILLRDILQPESEIDEKYYLSDKAIPRLLNVDNDGYKSNIKTGEDRGACVFASQYKLARGMDIICVAMRGRNPDNPNDSTPGSPTEQRLEPQRDGKTNTLTSVAKDNLIMQRPHGKNKGGERAKNSKTPSLTANASWEHNNFLSKNYKLRRLTSLECARLQTIPEWYEWIVSDTQIYKMLGNGWTVDVIKHIFSFIKL